MGEERLRVGGLVKVGVGRKVSCRYGNGCRCESGVGCSVQREVVVAEGKAVHQNGVVKLPAQ